MLKIDKKRKIFIAFSAGLFTLGISLWQFLTKYYFSKEKIITKNENREHSQGECSSPTFSEVDCLLDQGENKQKPFIIGSGGFYY